MYILGKGLKIIIISRELYFLMLTADYIFCIMKS